MQAMKQMMGMAPTKEDGTKRNQNIDTTQQLNYRLTSLFPTTFVLFLQTTTTSRRNDDLEWQSPILRLFTRANYVEDYSKYSLIVRQTADILTVW